MSDRGSNSGSPSETAPVGSYPDTATVRFVDDPHKPAVVEKIPLRTYVGEKQIAGPTDPASGIVIPTAADIRAVGRIRDRRCCGNCAHFRYDAGQAEISKQRFFARMAREQGWKGGAQWTDDPKMYGICDDRDDTAVHRDADADPTEARPEGCPNWRPKRGELIRTFIRGSRP